MKVIKLAMSEACECELSMSTEIIYHIHTIPFIIHINIMHEGLQHITEPYMIQQSFAKKK